LTNCTLKIAKKQLNRNENFPLKRHLKMNGGSIFFDNLYVVINEMIN